jgi:RNA polymerase sigma-70 factor (ECF subfamily)
MYQVAYSILRDEGMAEDAVQEAFLKLMKSDTCFDDVKSDDCKRYIITVIKHSSITIYNRKKREQQVIYFSDQDDAFAQLEEKADDADRQNLRLLMDKLPNKYYEVVYCMVVKELSVKETAEELAITQANVRKRFERAKLLLKTIVKGSGEYEEFRFI